MSHNTITLTREQIETIYARRCLNNHMIVRQYDDEIEIDIDDVVNVCAFGHIDCTSIACYNRSREIIGGDNSTH